MKKLNHTKNIIFEENCIVKFNMNLYQKRFEIRFTKNKDELIESQRLRHKIFIDEIGASNKKIANIQYRKR